MSFAIIWPPDPQAIAAVKSATAMGVQAAAIAASPGGNYTYRPIGGGQEPNELGLGHLVAGVFVNPTAMVANVMTPLYEHTPPQGRALGIHGFSVWTIPNQIAWLDFEVGSVTVAHIGLAPAAIAVNLGRRSWSPAPPQTVYFNGAIIVEPQQRLRVSAMCGVAVPQFGQRFELLGYAGEPAGMVVAPPTPRILSHPVTTMAAAVYISGGGRSNLIAPVHSSHWDEEVV